MAWAGVQGRQPGLPRDFQPGDATERMRVPSVIRPCQMSKLVDQKQFEVRSCALRGEPPWRFRSRLQLVSLAGSYQLGGNSLFRGSLRHGLAAPSLQRNIFLQRHRFSPVASAHGCGKLAPNEVASRSPLRRIPKLKEERGKSSDECGKHPGLELFKHSSRFLSDYRRFVIASIFQDRHRLYFEPLFDAVLTARIQLAALRADL